MKNRRRSVLIALSLFLVLAGSDGFFRTAAAQDEPAKTHSDSTLDLMGKKLRRGTANAGLGWLEVPAGVQEIGNEYGFGAAATWGVLHGTGRAVQRTAVGLFEIVTFPFALTQDYKPIIEPEFVLDKPKQPEPPAAKSEASDAAGKAPAGS